MINAGIIGLGRSGWELHAVLIVYLAGQQYSIRGLVASAPKG